MRLKLGPVAAPTVALRKESVDRNFDAVQIVIIVVQSLSARRAWIEIVLIIDEAGMVWVALRKESVDRNRAIGTAKRTHIVALRKESVDRNSNTDSRYLNTFMSLSARRAWIEIYYAF